MADYQRFVSYLYEYQNNTKTKNCGFCRTEVREHNCRLEIHLKLPIYPFTPTLKVYVFVPSKEKLYGIFLGNASYHQGNVSGTFLFTEKNIKDSSYHFSQLGGILIQTDTGLCFASAWKDISIHPEHLTLYEPKPMTPKNELCLPSATEKVASSKQDIKSDQSTTQTTPSLSSEVESVSDISSPQNENAEFSQENSESLINSNAEIKTSTDTEIKPIPLNINKEHQPEETVKKETSAKEYDTATLHTNLLPEPFQEEVTSDTLSQDLPPEKVISEPTLLAASMELNSTDTNPKKENFWEIILKSYPQCHPFFDDEIHNCVQLSPSDVSKLSTSGYPIYNNAFFRHNCQSFGHFLIGRKDCNSGLNKSHYILAVPGIYNPKEQYMASMFGFPYFKCGQNSRCRNHCWGYWYRMIPEHWNDCTL